jgi:hypothetical protein
MLISATKFKVGTWEIWKPIPNMNNSQVTALSSCSPLSSDEVCECSIANSTACIGSLHDELEVFSNDDVPIHAPLHLRRAS